MGVLVEQEPQESGSMEKYIIIDWAGNHLFPDMEFDSFDDGWLFLDTHFAKQLDEDERYLEDYFVVPLT